MQIQLTDINTDQLSIYPCYIFGHVRKSYSDFISLIPVKDLFMKNRDILAVSAVMKGSYEPCFHQRQDHDLYVVTAAYIIASLDSADTDKGIHCGDCTKVPATCTTCLYEGQYAEALMDLSYFNDLVQVQNNEIKEILKKFNDSTVLFMVICQFREIYWINFKKSYNETGKFSDDSCPDYKDSLTEFLQTSEDNQMSLYKRMETVKSYVMNPTAIEGIPWW